MQKYIVLIVCLLALELPCSAPADTDSIVLDSTILDWIDGCAIGINAQRIEAIKNIRRCIKVLHYGILEDRPGVILRRYTLAGKKYTLDELAKLESQQASNSAQGAQLKSVLEQAKGDFLEIIKPFNKDMKGVKGFISTLIEQSCTKRNRKSSYLLEWGACPEGREEEVFNRRVTSFTFLATFYGHLYDFLGDLEKSCPKACKKYEEVAKHK